MSLLSLVHLKDSVSAPLLCSRILPRGCVCTSTHSHVHSHARVHSHSHSHSHSHTHIHTHHLHNQPTNHTTKADRGLRPGVSVTLEGLFSKCRDNHGRELLVPGRTLIMRVAVPKIGTAVAFASADVTVDGFPVAQLSHIKYMPLRGFLGVAWALAFSPSGRWLTQRFGDAAVFGAIGAKMPKEPGPLVDDIGMLLELDDIQPDLAGAHALKAGFGPIRPEHTNPLVSKQWSHVLMRVTPSRLCR